MSSAELISEREGAVLVITLNRPESRNAITLSLARAIADVMDEFESDATLQVAILTGAGGNFCAGADLRGRARGEIPLVEGRGFAGLTQSRLSKPLIAAVEGYAVGGGFEIVLSCDMVVASRQAFFALPEARRGLVAGAGGVMRLPRRIPYHVAMQCILTGDMLGAPRAAELGLVGELVEEGEALSAALRLAQRIASNAPLAVAAAKRIVIESVDWPESEMFTRQQDLVWPVALSQDAREGALAFVEKRAPLWKGQ